MRFVHRHIPVPHDTKNRQTHREHLARVRVVPGAAGAYCRAERSVHQVRGVLGLVRVLLKVRQKQVDALLVELNGFRSPLLMMGMLAVDEEVLSLPAAVTDRIAELAVQGSEEPRLTVI